MLSVVSLILFTGESLTHGALGMYPMIHCTGSPRKDQSGMTGQEGPPWQEEDSGEAMTDMPNTVRPSVLLIKLGFIKSTIFLGA